MAGKTDRLVALISIHPAYADAILDGTKRVEFRRSLYPHGARWVVIYATAPVKRIVGWFEIERIATGRPAVLWQTYRASGGVDAEAFDQYFDDCDLGTAIEVARPVRLDEPLRLDDVFPDGRPPQSFRYMPALAAEAVGVPVAPA